MTNKPLFSVIIPTYNRAGLIPLTIKSFLAQTYQNFEIIIIDDGSKDNTEDEVRKFEDDRIHYFKVQNGERGRARNIGTSKAQGDYVTFIDSDDLAYPQHLEVAAQQVSLNQEPEVIHLAYEMKDSNGNLLTTFSHAAGDLNQQLLQGNLFSCIGVFLRKDVAKEFLFKEDRELAGTEDWLLWLTLAARFPIIGCNTITACMINHDSRSVLHFNKEQMLNRTRLLVQYLENDAKFKEKFGEKAVKRIEAHMFTYMSLHSVLSHNNADGLSFLIKGASINPKEIFQRRTLAIIKYLIVNTVKPRS